MFQVLFHQHHQPCLKLVGSCWILLGQEPVGLNMLNCAAKHSEVFGLMQPSCVGNLLTSGLMMQLLLPMDFLHLPQRKELDCS